MEFLFFLLVLLTIITLIGHGIWVAIRAFVRLLLSDNADKKNDDGITLPFEPPAGPLNDLSTTERQLVLFYRDGKINDETYELLMVRIRAERDRLLGRQPASPPKPRPAPAPVAPPPSVVPASLVATDDVIVIEPVPTFIAPEEPARAPVAPKPVPPPPPPPPRTLPHPPPPATIPTTPRPTAFLRSAQLVHGREQHSVGRDHRWSIDRWLLDCARREFVGADLADSRPEVFDLHDSHRDPFRHRVVHRTPLETSDYEQRHPDDRHVACAFELSRDCSSFSRQHFGRASNRQRAHCAGDLSLPRLFRGKSDHTRLDRKSVVQGKS